MRLQVFPVLLCLAGGGTAQAQDAALGEKAFIPCKACHQIGDGATNAIGPSLNGVIGRKAGTFPGYSYSTANQSSGLTWDEATFRDYIKAPAAKVPGTKMTYVGIKDDKRITDLLAYLKQFDATGHIVPR
ncbi:c-type cytochrome [Microvirga antarctica]|uniref:c-type cytochrome n=1 Tax=Microvirga antarctica TaxID=2819233 RepID=UPI001B300748|nr:cytochrome c family protein [Microvirga antarctica]